MESRDLAAGARQLRIALGTWLADRPTAEGFVRFEQPVDACEPLTWLVAQQAWSRRYLETPDGSVAIASLGEANQWDTTGGLPPALAARLSADPDSGALRFFLTSRFAGDAAVDEAWAPFGTTRVILPLVELRREAGVCTLAVNLDGGAPRLSDVAAEAQALLHEAAAPGRPAGSWQAELIAEHPGSTDWRTSVSQTLVDIEAGRLEKCVLARTRTYALSGTLDPMQLLADAARAQPGTFRFGVQVDPEHAFVGVTPELLFRRQGTHIESQALAGTRARQAGGADDEQLAGELFGSDKDRREHESVRAYIDAVLTPLLAGAPDFEGPTLRQLEGLQHLDTHIAGELRPGAGDGELLAALHPTPAVCGVPAKDAQAAIERREPFDRGLYAGAVGVIGRDEAIITVGIRSALHLGNRVLLLAGAGIVAGSDPDAEWQETGDKMRELDAILRAGRAV
jgi:menaquinone-specific isochorismate synthase